MEARRLLTSMALPQDFDGQNLTVNIVLIPRNADPFATWPTGVPNATSTVPGFADFQPEFSLCVVEGTADFPIQNPLNPLRQPHIIPVSVDPASSKAQLIQQVASSFNLPVGDASDKLPPVVSVKNSIKKYLPQSYRKAFNFTQPKHPNAVTDDSYECAIRDQVPEPTFTPPGRISWGKVFAHILRQPLLAKACGMIYTVQIQVEPTWFQKGGYLYVDVTNDPYANSQNLLLEQAGGPLIKRYAARIPKLQIEKERPVFAPVVFPVLYKKNAEPAPVAPLGPWDELFKEARAYDDGFAKIVHADQPQSGNLLKEKPDGFNPQYEAGIRLGWDDEQILIWYIRQLTDHPATPGERVDAPLSVMGYHLDVREVGSDWESLNAIELNPGHFLDGLLTQNQTELPYQVYPNKISGPNDSNFWLPMYYANWIGKNMVTEDKDAIAIYKTDQPYKEHVNPGSLKQGITPNQVLKPVPLQTLLRYGQKYEFRVRMADISGGGPKLTHTPLNPAANPNTSVSFRRFINPGMLRIEKPSLLVNQKNEIFNALDAEETQFDPNPILKIARPLLEYPAVVFTMKYQQQSIDPVEELKNLQFDPNQTLKPALEDPDVQEVGIRVEVKSLRMDNYYSQNGSDSYITLYQTKRNFPTDFKGVLEIPVEFIDVPVLNLGNEADPFFIDNLRNTDLDEMEGLVIPSGRLVRVTLRGIASTEGDPDVYFGIIDPDPEKDSRFGKPTQLTFYKEPESETQLLVTHGRIPEVQGIYLRPDDVPTNKQNPLVQLILRETETNEANAVKRLADALGLEAKGLTLLAPKGERIAFGCCAKIRHTLAPDGSSLIFSTLADLQNHWIGAISYKMQRDWAWDCLEDVAFVIAKQWKFRRDDAVNEWRKLDEAGEVEIKHSISFEALQSSTHGKINRGYTRIVFLDAIEPKNELKLTTTTLRHPDEIWVEYEVTPQFKPGHAAVPSIKLDQLKLPTVLRPSQMPKLKSVGLAFSPYERAEDYSSTEVRRRHLWVEFDEPVENKDDTYFCRVLANAPDQLLANNSLEHLNAPEESPLTLDPEWVRMISPGQSDDLAGLNAMQQMIPAEDSDRHFIVPIPPGMHAESPELFGFFTYEFRVGHAYFDDREDNLWSTAQGRFGRALRVTGIQHPAPNLLCSLNRDSLQMYVSAPFAKAVYKGKNVTSKPPRTSLWAVLYAQVHQADGLDFRNIFLGEKEMKIGVKIIQQADQEDKFMQLVKASYQVNPIPAVSSSITINADKIQMGNILAGIKDMQPSGTAVFPSQEIADRLKWFGLPEDSPLSVLVVEVFGNITNIFDHLDLNFRFHGMENMNRMMDEAKRGNKPKTHEMGTIQPLSRSLGHFRILRTSPLTRVPFVCCPTCE
ncbi:hypothetical protein [Pararhodonellum marinum]|uniref:hypothetical protein n=1 Tax=Pararhodonellum marinum TaxID=2755358 RepID=UPI00188EAAA3|nr:hypothetical protein [Pararhodonellum marinum]